MTALIILAAGSSSRMGKPKQNLVYEGITLLQRAVKTACASKAALVTIVLGANAGIIKPTINNEHDIHIIHNPDWKEGMASSIRSGISWIQKFDPAISSVILMLCDQPFVSTAILDHLIDHSSQKGIIACAYNYTVGVPALFNARYFNELLSLKGQEGAKKIMLQHPADVNEIPFPLASMDIDTIDDYRKIAP